MSIEVFYVYYLMDYLETYEVGIIILPTLQIKKQNHRQVVQFTKTKVRQVASSQVEICTQAVWQC